MKFSEKYELLESLTTGAIETFAANDRIRGERVLVHIVECAPQKPEQSTADWALESFRRAAPDPPGPVMETGKYRDPKYAYVVSRPADDTVVKTWIRQYELHAQETRETKTPAPNKTVVAPVAAPPAMTPAPPKESPQAPGQMTQLFRDFDSLVKSRAPQAEVMPEAAPTRPAPSSSLLGESAVHAAVPWEPPSAKAAVPKEPPAPAKPVAPELPSLMARDSSKPGEFTSFFQGPFQGDKPADMPAFSSQPIEPPRKSVGEFTALFGKATAASPSTPIDPPAPVSTTIPEPSFTAIFKDIPSAHPTFSGPDAAQGPIVPPSAPPAVPPVHATQLPDPVFVTPTPTSVVTPTAAAPVIPPAPPAPIERPMPPRPTSSPGDGATGAFMRPTAEPTPIPVEAPSGPSPYTQIISRQKIDDAENAEGGHAPAAGGPGGGKFAAPSKPKAPAAAPPPMPPMPAIPRIAPPPMPPMPPAMPKAAPSAPKAPKIDAPSKPPVSMLPLIITLGVVVFLAVVVVLYFVLKH